MGGEFPLRGGNRHPMTDDIAALAQPLRNAADLDPLLERVRDARVVMLGEASHGTSEYYVWRAGVTKRLIAEHGFTFVAVEGDGPDCYEVYRCV
jgi:erythromycin esterase